MTILEQAWEQATTGKPKGSWKKIAYSTGYICKMICRNDTGLAVFSSPQIEEYTTTYEPRVRTKSFLRFNIINNIYKAQGDSYYGKWVDPKIINKVKNKQKNE